MSMSNGVVNIASYDSQSREPFCIVSPSNVVTAQLNYVLQTIADKNGNGTECPYF